MFTSVNEIKLKFTLSKIIQKVILFLQFNFYFKQEAF